MGEISHRLRLLLNDLCPNRSLAMIARRFNVHPNTLNKYLNQGRLPSCEFLAALAQLGADINWLLAGHGVPLTKNNPARQDRIASILDTLSSVELMRELERRQRVLLHGSISLLHRVAESNLKPLARKLNAGTDISSLSLHERTLVEMVRLAWSSDGELMAAFRPLDSRMAEAFLEFTELHRKVTRLPAVETIAYKEMEQRALIRDTPLRQRDLERDLE